MSMKMPRFLVLATLMVLAMPVLAQTDPPAKPIRLRVSSAVAEGLKTHDVQPKYPHEAREKGIEGDVLLLGTIDTKGNIIDLRAVQGDPILITASMDAVKKWKYRPYKLKGEPVEVETSIRIQFHMR